jgi:hypothetical protein
MILLGLALVLWAYSMERTEANKPLAFTVYLVGFLVLLVFAPGSHLPE